MTGRAVEAERAAGREAAARARRGLAAEELDRLLSAQRHSAERDKAAALAGLKQLYAAELAQRDGHIRDLRAQRDSVMASVRQRDAALQARTQNQHLSTDLLRFLLSRVSRSRVLQAYSLTLHKKVILQTRTRRKFSEVSCLSAMSRPLEPHVFLTGIMLYQRSDQPRTKPAAISFLPLKEREKIAAFQA